jgi:hypothetical protein
MDASTALSIVDRLTFVIQRMRSIARETMGDDTDAQTLLSYLTPWLHGPKCLLPALTAVQDRGSVTPSELFNFCFIAHTLEPTIALTASNMALLGTASPIPAPSQQWLAHPWV